MDESAAVSSPTTVAPRSVRVLSVLLAVQAGSFAIAAIVGLWVSIVDSFETDSIMYGLVAVAVALAVLFGAMSRAAARSRSWFRGPAITMELLIGISVISSAGALAPYITVVSLVLCLTVLIMLFVPTVIGATTSRARLRGAYPEAGPDSN